MLITLFIYVNPTQSLEIFHELLSRSCIISLILYVNQGRIYFLTTICLFRCIVVVQVIYVIRQ